jgi:mannose-6-phosphate isomerase
MFVPAGTIHAYLSGLGLEIMATSDNVLRAGMTTKHRAIPELIESLSTAPTRNPMMTPNRDGGVEQFRPPVDDFLFDVVEVDGPRDYSITGPAIVVAIDGDVSLAGQQTLPLRRGSAAVIERGESVTQVFGQGEIVIVSSAKPRGWPHWFNR